MWKHLFAALAALLFSLAAHAAIDVNRATQAELEAVKGIGPGLSTTIVGERKKGEFKDWGDLVGRVKGVGERNAVKFSDGGLTVDGKAYAGGAPSAKPSSRSSGRGAKKAEQATKSGSVAATSASVAKR